MAARAERHARQKKLGVVKTKWELSPRAPEVPKWDDMPNKEWHVRRMAVYAAQIDRLDQGIGRVLAKIRELGQEENTLVMFLADNGGCHEEKIRGEKQTPPGPADSFTSYGRPWANASNTPFRMYKHWVHEGGISTPLIAHWPKGIGKPGRISHEPGHLIDILPTCLDVAGASALKERQGVPVLPPEGRSLVPAFANQPISREALYWEHEGNAAVRVGDLKLVRAGRNGPWELYDLKQDRTELQNLADAQPEKVKALAALWEAWAVRAQVKPYPEAAAKKAKAK